MNRYIILIVICNCFLGIAEGQYSVTNIPDSANIVTTDINHFWKAFDLLKSQRTTADSLKVIKINFVNQASEGLRRYMEAAHCHEREYLETIRNTARLGHTSGMIYDALHLACARKINADLIYTWNVKNFRSLAPDLADKIRTP